MTPAGSCKKPWFPLLCFGAIAAIMACNVWLLCVGHCAISDFLKIPPAGWVVIMANLFAATILFFIRRHRKAAVSAKVSGKNLCGDCQTLLRETWVYCPNCSKARVY